jgi:hypothetical protein
MPRLGKGKGNRFVEGAGGLHAGVKGLRAVVVEPGQELLMSCLCVGEDLVAGLLVVLDEGHIESRLGNVNAQEHQEHATSL